MAGLFLSKPSNKPEGKSKSVKNEEKVQQLVNQRHQQKSAKITSFDSADVLTCIGQGNVCVAIFKNPLDHKTHFFRTRLKGKLLIMPNHEYFASLKVIFVYICFVF